MASIVCFGELMMRLAPENYKRFRQADKFEVTYAGAEANVAVFLANAGLHSLFVSKVPANNIGVAAVESLCRYRVDISHVAMGGPRLGLYFVEKGASQRSSQVIYDRMGSSFQQSSREDYNWDEIFKDAAWFHFTGITPALGVEMARLCLEACREAKSRGITISCDLNYRSKLWSREQAKLVMSELCKYVDVCIANEADAYDVFEISCGRPSRDTGETNAEDYKYVASQLHQQFGFALTAITLRTSISASDNRWSGLLYDGKRFYQAPTYSVHIVDRVGSGDSFGAALIYACLKGKAPQEIVEFAAAAGCLNHTIEGDFNLVSVSEIEALVSGDRSGRIKR